MVPGAHAAGVAFWRAVASATTGKWKRDDAIYVHFVGDSIAGMVWFQVFDANGSLDPDPTPGRDAWLGAQLRLVMRAR
jgi:hypothetical protein